MSNMDLMGLLGGGGAPPEEAPEEAPTGITSPDSGENVDNLRAALRAVQSYMEEEQDDEDLAVAAKIVAQIQGLLSANQKLADQAMGMGPGAKYIRKQNQGGSQGGY